MSTLVAMRFLGWAPFVGVCVAVVVECLLPEPRRPVPPSVDAPPVASGVPVYVDFPPMDLELDELLPTAATPPEVAARILPAERARAQGLPKASAYWTPSLSEAWHVDQVIPPRLLDAYGGEVEREIASRLDAYKAQYVGIVVDGRRRIVGNYLCGSWVRDAELVKLWLEIADGGPCFFHFTYDPEDGAIVDFHVNGYG